ncbi:hypothetical protein [Chondrinema litorale]|uniref:hypothetical protein n=1 Tax=Chondrinema litorale TaxID=2994555 RepID=UPI000C45D862|nr:hypothetical protein [Chondrinema litorale]MBT34218.1 hypothetical protein [Thalassovita sp.]UZR94865.1 hypothetical protein OQ292_03435 [Chondrinema litorale]
MLTFQKFSNLSTENKLKYLSENGVLLCSRTYAKTKVSLYAVGRFYAEVWFNRNTDDISNVLPFTTTKCLKVYLDMIDISDVYAN